MTRVATISLAILLVTAGVGGVELGLGRGGASGSRASVGMDVERTPGYVDGSIVTAGVLGADGDLVLGTKAGVVRVFAAADRLARSWVDFQWREARVTAIALSADGSTVAAEQGGLGEEPGLLTVWRLKGDRMSPVSEVPSSDVWALGLSSDGDLLAVVVDGQLDVYSVLEPGRPPILQVSLQIPGPYTSGDPQSIAVGFNQAGTSVAAVAGERATAWSLATWNILWSVRCYCAATTVALSNNLEYAVFGTTDAHVLVWNLRHRDEIGDLTVTGNPRDSTSAVQIDDEGKDLAAAAEGSLSLWDSPWQLALPTTTNLTDGRIDDIQVTADGDRILVYKFPPPPSSMPPEQGSIGSGWLIRLR